MKRIILLITCLLLFSCKQNGGNIEKLSATIVSDSSKSFILDKNIIIFISPSSKKTAIMKKNMGEDFFTIADDANFYYSNAIHFLDSLKIDHLDENETKVFLFKDKNGKQVQIKNSSKRNDWYAILYNNDKKEFKITALSAFSEEYRKLYNEKNNITTMEAFNFAKEGKFSIIKQIKCDLNQDGIEDKIIVYKNNKEFDSDDDSTKQSPIVVFLGVGNNKFKKFENPNIFSNDSNDFFENLIIKDNFFTVELNNEVPDQYIIDKHITFKYNKLTESIVLIKYVQNLSGDKNETIIYTSENFGKIDFEQYNSNTIVPKISKK